MPSTPTVRRARGRLEELVREVCDLAAEGSLPLPEGQAHTPHRLAKEISARYPGSGVDPSTGAIADTLKRWKELGFAQVSTDPLAFVDYTDAGRERGLTALKEEAKARRLEERTRARAEAKAAKANGAATAEPDSFLDDDVADNAATDEEAEAAGIGEDPDF